jgi:spermidine synthase
MTDYGRRATDDGVPTSEHILHEEQVGDLRLVVMQRGEQIELFFANPSGTLDGPMSRIDPARPLHLAAEYSQTLMLSLLWQRAPKRICVLGFGGGRVPLVLHHYLPAAIIESVDIDAAFARVAERYFGVVFDERQRFVVADGRAFLEAPGPQYDIILMDAFSDERDALDHLATTEFYAVCRQRMEPGAVFAVNMLRSDARLDQKVAAFNIAFPHTYVVVLKHSLVLFGATHTRLRLEQLINRAAEIQQSQQFLFPFEHRAATLQRLRPNELGFQGARPLRDAYLIPARNS